MGFRNLAPRRRVPLLLERQAADRSETRSGWHEAGRSLIGRRTSSEALPSIALRLARRSSGISRSSQFLPPATGGWHEPYTVVRFPAVGLQQPHSGRIGHQDLKPSYVLAFGNKRDFRVADLSRAVCDRNWRPTRRPSISRRLRLCAPGNPFRAT
jgi:hypothetical protein